VQCWSSPPYSENATERSGAARYPLNVGIGGKRRALDHATIRSRTVVQGDEANVAAPPRTVDRNHSVLGSLDAIEDPFPRRPRFSSLSGFRSPPRQLTCRAGSGGASDRYRS
jgi:hypothetical protein